MKSSLILALLLSFCSVSFSQKNKKIVIHFWDAQGKTVKKEEDALFITTVQKLHDSCWQVHNYKMMGPMVSADQYKDKEGKLRHGRSSFMRPDGTLDSTGFFVNGKPDGVWMYFDTNGILIMKKEYSRGELLLTPSTGSYQKDGVHYELDTEALFTGGAPAWQMYLIKNLRYPPYAMSKKMVGSVKIYFLIDEKGNVQEDIILKSVEFTLDNETRRLVRESSKWIPATKNGVTVKSYQVQGVQFRLEGTFK